MDSVQKPSRILMMPWLAHGHLSPFLELAKKLTVRNFQVYFCSTPINLHPIRENQENYSSIQFIDFHLPSTPELPPNYHTTRNLPPHLMPELKTAFDQSTESFREIIRKIKPDLVIYDITQPWAPEIANQENVKSVVFMTFSAAATAFFFHYILNFDQDYPIPEFTFPERRIRQIIHFLDNKSNGLKDKDRFLECFNKSRFVLIKSLNDIEHQYADYLSSLVGKEVIPVGPLVQDHENKLNDSGTLMNWMNKRGPNSTVFVSFGTEYFLSKDEIEAIALGLELSSVSFIWLIRFPAGINLSLNQVLPEGFQRRVGEERGMVVQGWTSQAKILNHPCIGGFVSHCGMSSTMESIKFGVPIIAMPMQYDQHLNARLLSNIGVGMEVERENDTYKKEDIARVIKEVVILEEGKKIREKIKELSFKIEEKGDQEVDHVAKKLLQLIKDP